MPASIDIVGFPQDMGEHCTPMAVEHNPRPSPVSRDALHNLCMADPVWVERYEGWSALGHGGSASVVRTRSKATGEDVALKIFPRLNTEEWKRYTQEVRNAQRLTSAYIVRSYSAFPRETFAWIEMEWVDGPNLRQEIERTAAPFPIERALEIAAAVATALATAHAEGVIHRDVKPANILLPAGGKPVAKLGDFGLSRLADATRLTQSGLLVGTPQFAAPEVIEGRRTADGAADIYALSLCLFLMLSGGEAPFDIEDETTPTQWIWAHTSAQPRDIDLLNPNVPEAVTELLQRGLDKEPELRPTAAEFVRSLPLTAKGSVPPLPRTRPISIRWRARQTRVVAAAALACGLGLGALAVWMACGATPATPTLTRLTADAGLTVNPALSPDGKFLAYASDRAGKGNLDIWIQQIVGGQPLQLTHDEADDHEPSFSPDGTKIVFRSERAGGGVYIVPALGGEPRFLIPQGHRPHFSPDGTQVACLLGAARVEAGASVQGTVALVAAAGGAPQRFPLVREVSGPLWAPDGKHLLVVGNLDMLEGADDWWVVPTEPGQAPIRTGAVEMFQHNGLFTLDRTGAPDAYPRPFHWVGDRILFSAKLGDSTNVWEVTVSPKTFKVVGAPRRLTMGTEMESEPVMAPDGRIVFTAQRSSIDLWELDADTLHGNALSEPRRLTDDPAVEGLPNISPDGKKLLYLSTRLGTPDVWLRDIPAHTDVALTASVEEETMPVISRDGSYALYGLFAGKRKMAIDTVSTEGGGVPQRICEDCGVPTDASRDGRWIVLQYRPAWFQVGDTPPKLGRTSLAVLDRKTGDRVEILRHPNFNVYRGELSPDEKWIAFHGEHNGADTREFIAPFRGTQPIGEGDWITVVNGAFFNDAPQWSPDGNLLYYISDRDGFRCIWAQPLDPDTKAPIGGPIGVYHAHHRRPSLIGVGLGAIGVAVGRDRIVFNMMERWANLWSVDSGRR
jgi:Tol biopolymer transport system component